MLLIAGLGAAVLASLLFNLGLVLQGLEARTAPSSLSLRFALLVTLLHRWRWLFGWFLGAAGVVPQVLALSLAPFVVVQPALTVGLLLVLAVGVRTLGERVVTSEWIGVAAIIAGVVLVAGGSPSHTEAHRSGLVVLLVVGVLVGASLVPFAVRRTRLDSAELVMVASGAGFAAVNIALKLLSDAVGGGRWASAATWGGVAITVGVAATITGMTAFQRAVATVVVPVTTSVQTFLPIVLEPVFLREHWSSAPLDGALIALGMVTALTGTVLVARAPSVGHVVATATAGATPRSRSTTVPV